MNVMIIGWATFVVVWSKPVMMVALRSSRHTFGIIESAAGMGDHDAAHLVNMEQASIFNNTLLEFLSRKVTSSRPDA